MGYVLLSQTAVDTANDTSYKFKKHIVLVHKQLSEQADLWVVHLSFIWKHMA